MAETEAQWCHPAKVSEHSAEHMFLTSRNMVPHCIGVLGMSLDYFAIGATYEYVIGRDRK